MYIYLASPYTSQDLAVKEQRYRSVARLAAGLFKQGHHVFSPIVHCHPISVMYGMPGDIDFWREYDALMVRMCQKMYVATLPGWKDSKGVAYEIELAKSLFIPVQYIDEDGHILPDHDV